jgi:hypothetical protein
MLHMPLTRSIFSRPALGAGVASLLAGSLAVAVGGGGVVAQVAGPDRVPLIMTKLPPSGSATYKKIIGKAGKARGQVLTLTKTEMWEVPKENVEAVKKAASEHGAAWSLMTADVRTWLDSDGNGDGYVMRKW